MDLLDYLKNLSLEKGQLKGNEFVSCCPFHDERTPSFYFNLEKKVYHCFGCGISGNLVDFVKRVEGNSWKDVLKKIDKNLVLKRKEKSYDKGLNETLEKEFLSFFDIAILGSKFVEKKIGELIGIDRFKLKCKVVGDKGWIVFPVWDYQSRFIGYVMRLVSYSKKEYKTYGKVKDYLYGEWLLESDKDMVLVEGVFDVIGLSRYVDNVVGLFGTVVTDEQLLRIKNIVDIFNVRKVYVMFDPDDSGKREGRNLFKKLKLIGIDAIFCDTSFIGKDPKNWTKEDFEQCIKRSNHG